MIFGGGGLVCEREGVIVVWCEVLIQGESVDRV